MGVAIDVRELAVSRAVLALPRRRLLARYVLPGFLLLGFAGLIAYAARDVLSPPREVTVVPVLQRETTGGAPAGTTLFRAAGWVEPRPSPILASAKSDGIVAKVHVVEGQAVRQGELIAELDPADAQLGVTLAEADRELREAEWTAARMRFERPVHLEVDLADAEVMLSRSERELAGLPALRRAAEERQRGARLDWEGKRTSDATPGVIVARAASELEAAAATVEELKARQTHLPVEVAALKRKREAQKDALQRRTEESRQKAEAAARLKHAEAVLAAAQLRLKRMRILAPASGRILQVIARPGMRRDGSASGTQHDSSTIATLYQSVQVRVDVRLEDFVRVEEGMAVRCESATLERESLDGVVLSATAEADTQKNTLSVKVSLVDPPAKLRPGMLCQATFLAPPPREVGSEKKTRLFVPRVLVDATGDEGRVWLADRHAGRARQRTVQLGMTVGDLIEVAAGLSADDKLIASGSEGLTEGARIRVTGEDERLGIGKR